MNKTSTEVLNAVRQKIDQAQKIAVFCHVRPDGDAMGSLTGFGWALEKAGKTVQFVCPDELPPDGWLRPEALGRTAAYVREPGPYDLSILLDVSDIERAGPHFSGIGKPKPAICIDHHISNNGIAQLNWIDPDAPATASLIAGLLSRLGLEIDSDIASMLLSGIVMDTIGFSTSNTNPQVLEMSAQLMKAGADLYTITQKALKAHSYEVSRYWARGLSKLNREGQLVWTWFTEEDREQSGYFKKDDAHLIDHLISTDSALAAVIFIPAGPETVKVSWRAKPGLNVAAIAGLFGGGGHVAAAGAEVRGFLHDVMDAVLNETKREILRIHPDSSATGKITSKSDFDWNGIV